MMKRHLAPILAAALSACGGVEVDPITSGSTSAASGAGGSTTASTSSSSSNSTTTGTTATGTGGAACADAFITVSAPEGTRHLTSACSGSWEEAHGVSGPGGFFARPEGPPSLIIEGCAGPAAHDFPLFRLTLFPPPDELGSTAAVSVYYQVSDAEHLGASESITADVTELSPTEIAGTSVAVVSAGGAMQTLEASFRVCHLPDSTVGPY